VWDEDPVAFTGEFYTVPPASVAPKPVQRPHPPLLLGGGAEAALRRVGRLGDGWISASRHDLTRLGEAVRTVSDAAVVAGRDPSALRFVVRAPASLEAAHDGGRRQLMTGSADRIRADIEELGRQGATDVFLDPNFDPRVVAADVDPAAGHDRAWALLEALAPATA
jgi:alkanesulfonate monooxygenase SsuD/methylene tetrahydromethanopterin reductase-like flavin-dependent oxidoreductase (luciferase family)